MKAITRSVNFLYMKKANPKGARFDELTSARGAKSAIAKALSLDRPVINNWRMRGVPSAYANAVAELLRCSPDEISDVVLTPVTASIGFMWEVEGSQNVTPGPAIVGRVPLISWVRAGDWCEAIDNYQPGDGEEMIPCPFEHSERAFCLLVAGQSMMPDYREGEVILVDPGVEWRHGDDVVARTPDGNVTFKRLQITHEGTHLLALNPEWSPRIIELPADSHICGVVTASWMRRRR